MLLTHVEGIQLWVLIFLGETWKVPSSYLLSLFGTLPVLAPIKQLHFEVENRNVIPYKHAPNETGTCKHSLLLMGKQDLRYKNNIKHHSFGDPLSQSAKFLLSNGAHLAYSSYGP